jgi:predicted ester cyclase
MRLVAVTGKEGTLSPRGAVRTGAFEALADGEGRTGAIWPVLLCCRHRQKVACLEVAMSVEENKALIRRIIDCANRQDADAQADLYGVDAANHGRAVGREGLRRVFRGLYALFPDWHLAVDEMVAEGAAVVCLMTMTGTHRGVSDAPVFGGGLVGVAPTGRRVTVMHIHRYRIKDGLVIDHRATRDDLGMMQQLGLLPTPGQDLPRPPREA